MIYQLYKTTSSLLKPLAQSHLEKRVSEGKEDQTRLSERYGVSDVKRPKGPLIWFHAASVGEALSVLTLINHLLKLHDTFHILVTTGTKTSAAVMEKALPDRCVHQYVPFDVIDWVKSFHDHWHPDLAIFVESEFWPNLLYETKKRNIPMMLLNASISHKSFNRWKNANFLANGVLELFDLIIAQSQEDQQRLTHLGAKNVSCYGNLKFASTPLSHDPKELAQIQKETQGRQIWVAASTHPGEEEVILRTHDQLLNTYPDLLTLIVPRHPERGQDVQALAQKISKHVSLRSQGEKISLKSEVYIADTMGELGLFYHLSPIVFLGGSLGTVGGHNLIEPAQLNCAVLHGPNMFNQQEMTDLFLSNEASMEVADGESLTQAVESLFKDPALLEKYSKNAKSVADSQVKIIELVLHEMVPYLRALVENDHQRTSILV